jgi:hypothetical protein
MRRGEYAKTRRGQLSRLRARHHRRLFLRVQQQPQSKNIHAHDAIAFQQALLGELEARNRLAYRGPVFLQLDFFNKSKTPPAIYSLPKNYLDLMEKPRKESAISRQQLLYRNDRQVKALIVRYHIDGLFEEPEVCVRAEPFRDFLADAELVDRVTGNSFTEGDNGRYGSRQDSFRDSLFRVDASVFDESRQLAEFESDKDAYLRIMTEDAYEAMRFMMRHSAQQEFLLSQDRYTCSSLLALFQYHAKTRKLPFDDPRSQILAASRNEIIRPPLMMELHHAPRRKGDSERFVADLDVALREFKNKYRVLFPLATMLNVTVLMVPPLGGGKDLDNLARLVLPKVHKIWSPPSHFVHAACGSRHGEFSSHWQAQRDSLPRQQQESITEYRMFEIPRMPNDPEEGLVRLAVGAGFRSVEFREEIDEFLDKWRDDVERF